MVMKYLIHTGIHWRMESDTFNTVHLILKKSFSAKQNHHFFAKHVVKPTNFQRFSNVAPTPNNSCLKILGNLLRSESISDDVVVESRRWR